MFRRHLEVFWLTRSRFLYPHGCYGLKLSHATRHQADILFLSGLEHIIRAWSIARIMHCFCSVAA